MLSEQSLNGQFHCVAYVFKMNISLLEVRASIGINMGVKCQHWLGMLALN